MRIFKIIISIFFLTISSLSAENQWIKTNAPDYIFSKLAVHPNGDIYCGSTENGVFRSSDGGQSWSQLEHNPTTARINDISFNSTNGDIFICAADGLYKSSDNGESWTVSFQGEYMMLCFTLESGKILAGLDDKGMYISTDGGDSWDKDTDNALFSLLYMMFQFSDGAILLNTHTIAHDGIFISINDGVDWTEATIPEDNPYSFDFAENSEGELFYITFSAVCKSTDRGMSWVNISDIFEESRMLDALLCAPNDYLFFSCSDFNAPAEESGVFRSTNGGLSWSQYGSGMPENGLKPKDLILNSENKIIAATKEGIWITSESVGSTAVEDAGDQAGISALSHYNRPGLYTIACNMGWTTDLSAELYDLEGNLILNKQYSNISENLEFEIDLSDFAKGAYYLIVRYGENLRTLKLPN